MGRLTIRKHSQRLGLGREARSALRPGSVPGLRNLKLATRCFIYIQVRNTADRGADQ